MASAMPPRSAHFCRDLLDLLARPRRDHDVSAIRGESACDRRAGAATAAGHHGGAAGEGKSGAGSGRMYQSALEEKGRDPFKAVVEV